MFGLPIVALVMTIFFFKKEVSFAIHFLSLHLCLLLDALATEAQLSFWQLLATFCNHNESKFENNYISLKGKCKENAKKM